eukprot:4622027-Prorocentrum_lima.AAC.1
MCRQGCGRRFLQRRLRPSQHLLATRLRACGRRCLQAAQRQGRGATALHSSSHRPAPQQRPRDRGWRNAPWLPRHPRPQHQ